MCDLFVWYKLHKAGPLCICVQGPVHSGCYQLEVKNNLSWHWCSKKTRLFRRACSDEPLSHQGCQGRCPLYQEFGVLPTLPEFMSYSNISRSHFALKLQNMYIQWGFLPDSKSLLISNTESAHSCKTPPNKSQRQGLTSSGEFLKVACFNSDCCLPGELRRIVSQDVPRAL